MQQSIGNQGYYLSVIFHFAIKCNCFYVSKDLNFNVFFIMRYRKGMVAFCVAEKHKT